MTDPGSDHRQRRGLIYAIVGVVLLLGSLLLSGLHWQGSRQLHTLLETIASVLALTAGGMVLVRYYARKTLDFLLLGCGFLGVALLDGFHAIVTSSWCEGCTASSVAHVAIWSGMTARVYLACLICSSWLIGRRQERNRTPWRLNERVIYLSASAWTLCAFLFFTFVPLGNANYAHAIVPRPFGLVAGILFATVAAGHWRKRTWKTGDFDHWLLLFLIVSASNELFYMPFSNELYDLRYFVSHGLKILSYALVLAGLFVSMYSIYRREAESHTRLEKAYDLLGAEVEERQAAEAALLQTQRELEARVEARTAELAEQGRELKAAHAEIALFLTSIPSILIGMDSHGHVTRWNQVAAEVLGAPRGRVIGRTLDDCGIQWKHPDIGGEIARWLRTEGVYRCDELHYEKDGRVRSLGLTVRPIIAPQKGVTGFIITGADITERNNAAAALTHLAAIVEATDSAIIGADLEGRILNWNAAAERIYGYSLEEMKGRPVSVLWPPECGSELAEVLRRLNLGESVEHVESVRVRLDRSIDLVSDTSSQLPDGFQLLCLG